VLVGPNKQLKQIFQIEHNIVKNPNWTEANQLAIYNCGRGFELGATEKQTQVVVRAGGGSGFNFAGLLRIWGGWAVHLGVLFHSIPMNF